MKHKGIIIFLSILFVISTSCTVIGYLNRNKNQNNKPIEEPEIKHDISYVYYLEDLEVNEMPKNELIVNEETGEEILKEDYTFSKFQCTNGLNGDFDTEKWEFIPENQEVDSICSLYFVKTKYEVTITPTQGINDFENPAYIDRLSDGKFKIIPNDGYKFSDVTCSGDKSATWDESTSTLNINAITSDVACKVNFQVKALNFEVKVKEGTGATNEKVYYGNTASAIVEPNDGYDFTNGNITCTNDQIATYENNKLTIEKLTNDTSCLITFKKAKEVKYTFKISNPEEFANKEGDEKIVIVQGSKENSVVEDSEVTIGLQTTGPIPSLNCGDIKPSKIEEPTGDNITLYKFYVKNNITCKIVPGKAN